MTDLSKTIQAKSDQLNADDLMGGAITIEITKVSAGTTEQPIAINYKGDNGKPFYPCKSMRRVLVAVWGANGVAYIGRNLTLYRDAKVKFGGIEVGGIRISHMSGIDKPIIMALTASKANKKPFTVKPLVGQQAPAQDVDYTALLTAAVDDEALKAAWLSIPSDKRTAELTAHKDKLKQQLTKKEVNNVEY